MNYDFEHTPFTKSLMAGLFAGLVSTMLSLIYNTVFRSFTEYPLSEFINVSTVSFSVLLVVTIAGLVFYFFDRYFVKSLLFFTIASLMVTAALIALSFQVTRSNNPIFNIEFKELLTGIVLITGLCITFVIPFFFKHNYV